MPEVNVEIDGKRYRMACEDGQQQHLLDLADRFNRQVQALKGAFGEIGDNRLVVMAGIAVLDELAEVIQDAWCARASAARRRTWLASLD